MQTARAHGRDIDTVEERRSLGQSLVETAIVLPILLLLLAAVVDFGRAFDASIVLTNACREGARYAVNRYPPPPTARIEQIVIEDVVGSGTNITAMGGFTVTNVSVISNTEAATVTAWYDFDMLFGGLIGLPSVRLSREAVMPFFAEW
jgi:Flp pilus assembly protein TadG